MLPWRFADRPDHVGIQSQSHIAHHMVRLCKSQVVRDVWTISPRMPRHRTDRLVGNSR